MFYIIIVYLYFIEICFIVLVYIFISVYFFFSIIFFFFFVFFFFFSSRRRHTRFSRDWSSDVYSSDLARAPGRSPRAPGSHRLDRFPKCRDPRHCQLDVVPDLPRSPAAEGILRRRILPCCDNDQRFDEWRTEADCRGTRIGYILFGTGSESRAGQAVDDVG